MPALEIARRWTGLETVEKVVALEDGIYELSEIVPIHRPHHFHKTEGAPAIDNTFIDIPSSRDIFENDCIDWRSLMIVRLPLQGQIGAGIEAIFYLNGTREEGTRYRFHAQSFTSKSPDARTRLLRTIGSNINHTFIDGPSQRLILDLLQHRVSPLTN